MTAPTVENFITPMEAKIEPGKIVLRSTGEVKSSPTTVWLEFDANKLSPTIERIELNDGRLARSWGKSLYRIQLKATSPVLKDVWTFKVRQD